MVKRPVLLHQNDYMFDSLIGSDQNCARRGQQSKPFHAKGALVKADAGDESLPSLPRFFQSCVEKKWQKIAFFPGGMLLCAEVDGRRALQWTVL